MVRSVIFLLWGSLITGCSLPPQAERAEGEWLIVLENATLIDGTGAPPRHDAILIIEDSLIARVGHMGEIRYPDDATVYDLTGRYIVPGFIEMHAHLPGDSLQQEMLQTYVAFGVTTLFNPAATPSSGVEVRDKIATGALFGPQVFTAGQALNGPSFLDEGALWVRVDTEEEVRAEVRRQADIGVDFIKVYAHLPAEHVRVAVEEAHRLGLPVVGHLGKTSWGEAARAGIDIILHSALSGPTWELVPAPRQDTFRNNYFPSVHYPEDYDPSRLRLWRDAVDWGGSRVEALVEQLVEKDIAVDPDLVVFESILWGDDPAARERLEPDFAPESMAAQWRQGLNPATATWSEEDFAEARATWPIFLDFVRILHERGVTLTAGSDLGNAWITPGPALHREFELLVTAGIPPLDVLSIATANAAEALGILDEAGTIEAGKRADLVVLTDDPIRDIRNTRKIEGVIMKGRYYHPDSLLAAKN